MRAGLCPAALAVLALTIVPVGCGPKTPDYQSIWTTTTTTTPTPTPTEKPVPFAQYLKSWPCKRIWERAAMDCVTNGCERLHTEVFRAGSLEELAARAQAFFSMMPRLQVDSDDEQDSEAAGGPG